MSENKEFVRKEIELSGGRKIVTKVEVFTVTIENNDFVFEKGISYGNDENINLIGILFPLYDPLLQIKDKKKEKERVKRLSLELLQKKQYKNEIRKLISIMSYDPKMSITDVNELPAVWVNRMAEKCIIKYMESLDMTESKKKA